MPTFRWEIARSQEHVDLAQQTRWVALGEENGIPVRCDARLRREISAFDNLRGAIHVLVFRDQAAVGTARLLLPNRDVAQSSDTRLGLELEREFNLEGLSSLAAELAEVGRVCVFRRHHRSEAVIRLYEGLYILSRQVGVRYWIGGVDCQTSREDEAWLMHAVLTSRGLMAKDQRVEPLDHGATPEDVASLNGRQFYSDDERARASSGNLDELRIASTLATFTRRLGAKCIGRPALHPAFPRFVMPMLTDLDELPAETRAKFDLSELAPRPARTFARLEATPTDTKENRK